MLICWPPCQVFILEVLHRIDHAVGDHLFVVPQIFFQFHSWCSRCLLCALGIGESITHSKQSFLKHGSGVSSGIHLLQFIHRSRPWCIVPQVGCLLLSVLSMQPSVLPPYGAQCFLPLCLPSFLSSSPLLPFHILDSCEGYLFIIWLNTWFGRVRHPVSTNLMG